MLLALWLNFNMDEATFKNLIKNDSWRQIDDFLADKSPDERLGILNGTHHYGNDWKLDNPKENTTELIPICQAVINGSLSVVKIFIRYGANIYETDKNHQWNIIHYLIILSYYQKENEAKYAEIYNQLTKVIQKW